MGEISVEVKIKKVTAAQWALVFFIGLFVFFVAYITRHIAGGWTVNGWFVGLIYIIALLEALKRMNPKLRISPTLLTLILMPMFIFGGKTFLATFTGETNFTNVVNAFWNSWAYVCVHTPETREIYLRYAPSWLVPRDLNQVELVVNGGGGPIDWGVWIPPIIGWSIILVATWILNTFIAFLITGPRWVEIEKLVFPPSIPATYLVKNYTSFTEEGKSILFNLKDRTIRVFWIAMIVGLIVGLPTYLAIWMPELRYVLGAAGGGLAMFWVDIRPIMQAILPGAQGVAHLYLGSAFWTVLLPWDTIITVLLVWLILGILYPTIAVRVGLVPYSPGMEGWNQWSIGAHAANPFPYTVMIFGFPIGLGIWYIWSARDYIIKGIKALSGKDIREGGMSYRFRMIGLMISFILLVAVWSAAGMPAYISLILVIVYVVYSISAGRVWAEFGPWGLECSPSIWMYVWPVGAVAGAWGWVPAEGSSIAIFSMAGSSYSTCIGFNNDPTSIGGHTWIYRVGYDSGSDLNSLMKWSIIMAIIFVPLYLTFDVWFSSHYGYINTAMNYIFGWNHPLIGLGQGVTSLNYWLGDPGRTLTWFAVGIVLSLIIAALRTRYAWFFINPIMMVAAVTEMHWLWLNFIIAAIVKYALTKSLGPAKTIQYMIPLIAGFLIGVGLPYLISGFIILGMGAANLAAYWR
ncbi:MAG: DUF6785 family protein [Candidatus Bathyarchaeia archaeon]